MIGRLPVISASTLDTPLNACWQPGADQYEDSDSRGLSLSRLPLNPRILPVWYAGCQRWLHTPTADTPQRQATGITDCRVIRFLAFDHFDRSVLTNSISTTNSADSRITTAFHFFDNSRNFISSSQHDVNQRS